ncbi:MAG TPA: UDP-3-O-(3-hydroxymyristoyl)glucosamine N-acyltransferase [Rubrivivax sp.]|nr:UDP-3-O-(3-hydroxymyristoyl)glucosamine N-acyltransferase [Rubrivivax sp.]
MPAVRASLGELSRHLDGELIGDPLAQVSRIAPLESATADAIAFLSNPLYRQQLATCSAGCVIVGPALRNEAAARGATIVCADPYLAFARLTQWWKTSSRAPASPRVHPSAVIEPGAIIASDASIGALAYIAAAARIESGAVVSNHCSVGAGAVVGAHSTLMPRVTLADACCIGERGIIHSGAVIGADGFGFAPTEGRWEKIEQLGAVVICDDVEIGANTCIDRGALEDTVLEDGVKLDNLVQIGHNVRIGAHTAFAGCVGVAGSARIGRHCTAGGGAIILGHLEIVDHVHISAATVISRSIRQPGQYSGVFPFDDNAAWEKNAATLRQLHRMRDRVRALEQKS